jgi:NitT/TauT family transport system substrate-binding protein
MTRLRLSAALKSTAAIAVSGLMLTGALAGCGAGATEAKSDTQTGTADAAKVVTFSYVPTPGIAPIFVGLQQGFFKAEGIDMRPKLVTAGQLSTSLMSGEADLSMDAVQGVLGAASNGLPIQVLAQTSNNEEGAIGGTGRELIVLKGSTIKGPADLIGKTLGVQRLGAAGDTAIQALAKKLSGNPDAEVKVLAIPASSMETALRSGDIDAANITDPYASEMMATGDFVALGDPPLAAFGTAPDKVVICTAEWAKKNPDLVRRLQSAIAKSVAHAQANPEAVKKVLVEDWETKPAAVEFTHWPKFTDQIDMDATDLVLRSMRDLGFVKGTVDLSVLFVPSSS